ncbi:MAG: DUF1517 domain-containing protein, partial [Chloroflexota bacterium]
FFMFGRQFFSGVRGMRGRGGGGYALPAARHDRVTLEQVDVALLGSASAVPAELHRLVAAADTSSRQGYSDLVQDAALLLLRNRQFWHSAATNQEVVRYDQAESAYNQLTLAARSRLSYETVSNIGGRTRRGTATPAAEAPDDSGGSWIVVTIIAAALQPLEKLNGLSADTLESLLRQLAGTSADALEAAEVVWVPDEAEQALTRDELLAKFPSLVPV